MVQGLPVNIADAMLIEIISRVRNGRTKMSQEPCAAAAWNLPNPEEAKDMVYPVGMEVPTGGHANWSACQSYFCLTMLIRLQAHCQRVLQAAWACGQRCCLCIVKPLP